MKHRRAFLQQSACGFGSLAAASLLARHARGELHGELHHAPRAKRVIFLFMQGGVSQVDSFDPKPLLDQRDGQMMPFDDSREFANTRKLGSNQRIMKSLWEFRRYGECGRSVSDLFPRMAEHVDKMAILHSMHTEGIAHGPATLFLHTGTLNTIRPSMGAWTLYGLGSENENLPGFISIAPSIGNGGSRNYGSAFLPARFQGTPIGVANRSELAIADIQPPEGAVGARSGSAWNRQQELLRLQQRRLLSESRIADADELDALIASYELAARMQSVAPELLDMSTETEATQRMYGLDNPVTERYGRRCLLARRLCEAGVRYIQVNYGDDSANPAWDQHSNLPKHAEHALAVDQPIAALLTDLAQRGLLEDTLVWWGGEFGRTPYAEKNGTGRDHNPGGFTVWLAGGGVRGGITYGETDEFGHRAIANKVHMHDLHATILHQLGLDHERLTYRHAGRDFRLTDVHGRVVRSILA
ncbi:MAG: DUF1501 domain-containing protein [Planctomycetota bacterium]|jgi:hypothetical protein